MLAEWGYDHHLTEDYQGETVNSDIAESPWNSKFRPLTNVNNFVCTKFLKNMVCVYRMALFCTSKCVEFVNFCWSMSVLSLFGFEFQVVNFCKKIGLLCQFLQGNLSALSFFVSGISNSGRVGRLWAADLTQPCRTLYEIQKYSKHSF